MSRPESVIVLLDKIMRDGKRRTLYELRAELLKRFSRGASECAISARIRELRKDYEAQGHALDNKARGKSSAHEYWFVGGGDA